MPFYKNKKTGVTISVTSALLSPEWELVKNPAPAAVPAPAKAVKPAAKPAEKKSAVKKPTTSKARKG